MEDRDFEQTLKRVFKQDLSAGTDEFRDALLARCLAALVIDFRSMTLSDSELDLIAAAGDPYTLDTEPSLGDNTDTGK